MEGQRIEIEVPAAHPLTNQSEHDLRQRLHVRSACQQLFGCGCNFLMSRENCSPYRRSKQAAIKQKRVFRHAKPNRRSEDARMLGCILRLRMLEPDFARFPVGRGQEAVELGDRGHRHLAIMARFGE